MSRRVVFPIFLFFALCSVSSFISGHWEVLQDNIGIVAMHMQLLHNDIVIVLDRTDFGRSNLSLPFGECRRDPRDRSLLLDCTAHSIAYNVTDNTYRPLTVQTDVWCSSGSVLSDGSLVQIGGFNDGDRKVRVFAPCANASCDWNELGDVLKRRRWYSSNHVLPDGGQIIVGGRRQFNYEYHPKVLGRAGVYDLHLLAETNDRGIENNLYPFVFLNVDGNLFIFANNRSVLFDYKRQKVIRRYPDVPGGDPRSYPSTGSAVLLPLSDTLEAEVLVCGGAPKGSFERVMQGVFVEGLASCGRIKITAPNSEWQMEPMPMGRVMGDMTLLPNGDVFIVNGASSGTAGWNRAENPVLNPLVYRPGNPFGSRFEIQTASTVPRMYHSSAILLRDGRVLVGGSNPHVGYKFSGVAYPTELRLEAFYPPYLDAQVSGPRPVITWPDVNSGIGYGQNLCIRFRFTGLLNKNLVSVTIVYPSFTTHAFSMNQRLIILKNRNITAVGWLLYDACVVTPRSINIAPSGYYMLFVVHHDIPSDGLWVHIK